MHWLIYLEWSMTVNTITDKLKTHQETQFKQISYSIADLAKQCGISIEDVCKELTILIDKTYSTKTTSVTFNLDPTVEMKAEDFKKEVIRDIPQPTPVVEGSEGSKSYRVPLTLRYDLIPWLMLSRLAAIFEEGAQKYGESAYIKKPLPFSVVLNHIMNHLNLYINGDRSEDHLSKIIWGFTSMMVLEKLHEEGSIEPQNDLATYGITVDFEE